MEFEKQAQKVATTSTPFINQFATTEQACIALRKAHPLTEKKFDLVMSSLGPEIDQWLQDESQRRIGHSIGLSFFKFSLVRLLWRSVVVGESFPKIQDDSNIDWSRSCDRIVHSVFPDLDADRSKWISRVEPPGFRDEPKISLMSRLFQNFPFPLCEWKTWMSVDRRFKAMEIDFIWSIFKRIDRKNAPVNVLVDLVAREMRPLLSEAALAFGWNLIHLKRPDYVGKIDSFDTPDFSECLSGDVSVSTKALIRSAIQEWGKSVAPQFRNVAIEVQNLKNFQNRSNLSFFGHPDLSEHYMARLTATRILRIPSFEVQHGAFIARYKHSFYQHLVLPTDFHIQFGQDAPTKRDIPGVFSRTTYFKPKKFVEKKSERPKVMICSYFTADFDLCEVIVDEKQLIRQEVNGIEALVKSNKYEVYLKNRPSTQGRIWGHIDPEVRKKIHLLPPRVKAGQGMCKEFDATVVFYYSTVLLEAISVGVPVIYSPTESEKRILKDEFIELCKKSTSGIKVVGVEEIVKKLDESLNKDVDLNSPLVQFSARYASKKQMHDLVRRIEDRLKSWYQSV